MRSIGPAIARTGAHSDTFLFADTLLKYGIGSDTEVRVSLTPYIHSRTRDASGASSVDGFGDVGLSFRHRLIDGGDGGISVAFQPTVVLPVGSDDVSTGTVSGSITLPIDMPVSGGWSLNATPSVAAAPDADGDGRHLAYAGVVAVSHGIGGNLSATGELFVQREEDPGGHSTQATADFLLAWQPVANWQFDVSSYVGINRTTPDLELLAGFTRRF